MFFEKLIRYLFGFNNKNTESNIKEIYFSEVKNPILAWAYVTIKD